MASKIKTRRVTIIRRIVQLAFGSFLIGTSLAHNLIGETTGLPIASAEALCLSADIPTSKQVKELESIIPDFEVDLVRQVVKDYSAAHP